MSQLPKMRFVSRRPKILNCDDRSIPLPVERCGYTWPRWFDAKNDSVSEVPAFSCVRETLADTHRCAWHADPRKTDEKTVEALQNSRVPAPIREKIQSQGELLNGANLENIEATNLGSLSGVHLRGADLNGANLNGTNLSEAVINGADLTGADLRGANLKKAQFNQADLTNADIIDSDMTEANLTNADLKNATLILSDLTRASFRHADLTDADLSAVTLVDTDFTSADLTEANCQGVVFCGANLRNASFSPVCDRPQSAKENSPTLEDAQLEDGTDLRGTDLSGAKLYQTAFRDVRINDDTIFGIEDETRGRACRYDYDPNSKVLINDGTTRLDAAAWTYRRLESIFDANAMDQRARNAHIRKEEAHRSKAKSSCWTDSWMAWFRNYIVPTISYHLHRHGESVSRLLGVSAALIVASGLIYSVTGVARENPEATFNLAVSDLKSGSTIATEFLNGLYFSIITFSTIGYGDYYPASPISQVLVGIESLAGAVFIALFVFVLGRRVSR